MGYGRMRVGIWSWKIGRVRNPHSETQRDGGSNAEKP